ncbi:ABC transporter ATP-binding protein [Flexithrix dorotheae]|uniref:ABC transporter ATP-binding protein n=1 Tax=Flexithrix dorotheae TaxID=70993 RepID=UPI00036F4229|nr:ATP-binding cassette domain-containing protein [Flexithrix dorotheae]
MDLLRIENVTKRYAGHTALKNINISIPEKSIFGLLGPNGAGKTSLIRIITQITGADEGEIFFREEKLHPRHGLKIGYLPEERGLYKKMKVGEQLIYLSRLKGLSLAEVKQKLPYWIEKFEIKSWLNKKIEDLSKGMQQKVQFIATVLHQPELIILDEPFSGFDPINANLIKDEILQLREKGCTIIFSTHRMETVEELCDHLALINKAEKVLDGKKSEIKTQYKTNLFEVETNQPVLEMDLSNSFSLQSSEQNEIGWYKSLIRINGSSSNELINSLIPKFEIHSIKEIIPSINDIFIKMVKEGNGNSLNS